MESQPHIRNMLITQGKTQSSYECEAAAKALQTAAWAFQQLANKMPKSKSRPVVNDILEMGT